MEQQWNPSFMRPWYLNREGKPIAMDQMGPMLYDGSYGQMGMNSYPTGSGIWMGQNEDSRYLRELTEWQRYYPEKMKKLQKYVEEACDRLDYDGSMIYDEQPDTLAIEQLTEAIRKRIMQDEEFADEFEEEEDTSELYETLNEAAEVHATEILGPGCPGGTGCPSGYPPRPPRPPRPYPPGPSRPPFPGTGHPSNRHRRNRNNWIQDIIPVLLFQEIFKRRSNRRNRQRRFY